MGYYFFDRSLIKTHHLIISCSIHAHLQKQGRRGLSADQAMVLVVPVFGEFLVW